MPLYVVSTPIGNLKDITLRAIDILTESDIILAEDTRRTGILLNHYNIKNKKLVSFNDFNKERKTMPIIHELKKNLAVSIVSDSGTPGISDPGFYIVREAIKNDVEVIPVPGATASIAALISSGFATDSFVFYGFIPKKEKAKRDFFDKIKNNNMTTIIYESPHRLLKTLDVISNILPERKICIGRELTKKFEEVIRGKSKDVYIQLENRQIKGEITIIIDKL
ncbi:MAG: 16S rRNA (cytidine(1402)-2'-O)-methyltransferase [Nanoarchaeota archaeon]